MMRRWLTFTFVIFATNFVWEMAQGGLFAKMTDMPFWVATRRCFVAAIGDVVIVAIGFTLSALIARSSEWPLIAGRRVLATTSFFAIGIAITIGFERWSVASGRWQYGARMPVVFGMGVSPLLQWVAVPLLALVTFHFLWRRQ
jgi:hypothetical protein